MEDVASMYVINGVVIIIELRENIDDFREELWNHVKESRTVLIDRYFPVSK